MRMIIPVITLCGPWAHWVAIEKPNTAGEQ
jgi:hypothetical protein